MTQLHVHSHPHPHPHPHPHRKRRAAAALALAALAVLGPFVPAANAHDQVAYTAPAESEQLDTAPADVTMQFTDEVIAVGALMLVVDESGQDWVDGPMAIDGATVVQPLKTGLPDGTFDVRWRVVSADGHPISGTFRFSVGDEPPAEAPGAGSSTGEEAGEDEEAGTHSESEHPDARAEASAAETGGLPLWGVGLIGAGIGLAAFAVFAVLRRKKSRP